MILAEYNFNTFKFYEFFKKNEKIYNFKTKNILLNLLNLLDLLDLLDLLNLLNEMSHMLLTLGTNAAPVIFPMLLVCHELNQTNSN